MTVMIEFESRYDFQPLPGDVFDSFGHWRSEGRLGFLSLPFDEGLRETAKNAAFDAEASQDSMVVTGIGGSALGLKAILGALGCPSGKRVLILDSPHPAQAGRLAEMVRSGSTGLTVITKSGGTAETIACFLKLLDELPPGCEDRTIVAITDPRRGDLRKLATDRGWTTLAVPSNVGGRYSVLSPVGMYPAAFAGIDIDSIHAGAASALEDYEANHDRSLAARIAAAFKQQFTNYPIHVFFVYSDRLMELGHWFAQLWAESLGKRLDLQGNEVCLGQTPLACRGPADQHSLVQLFMEGPADKAVTFLTASEPATGPIPGGFEKYPSFSYLEGITLGQLRAAESEATLQALMERGLPVCSMHMPQISGRLLGELIMALQIATVLVGLALGINPLDQPGVERGKILTYKALGRPGYS